MSKPKISLQGAFPPLPTPFDAKGDVAIEALVENITRLNEYDLSGYVVLGSNGEAVYMAQEEKAEVWHAAREAIGKKKLMIAGAGCESTRQTISLTLIAAEAGADAVLLVTPHYYGGLMTPDRLVKHYQTVADEVPIPVLIYTVPKFTHVDMNGETIARAASHPNIVGIKDTSGNIAKMANTVRLAQPEFQVLAGSASFILPGLSVGAVGGIMALANIAPQQCIDLYQAFKAGKMDKAAELQRWAIPVNAAVTARFGIPGLKAAMDMLDYFGGHVRSPLTDLTDGECKTLRAILEDAELL
jgi:4-hydroxy-2-oxoglutarate aldolase